MTAARVTRMTCWLPEGISRAAIARAALPLAGFAAPLVLRRKPMRSHLRFTAIAPLALPLLAFCVAPARSDARRFAVHAQRLIDGRSSAARGSSWVVISGDTIESVQSAAPAGLEVVELGDATLLP